MKTNSHAITWGKETWMTGGRTDLTSDHNWVQSKKTKKYVRYA